MLIHFIPKGAGLLMAIAMTGGCAIPLIPAPQPAAQVQPLPVAAPVVQAPTQAGPIRVTRVTAPAAAPDPVVAVTLTQEEMDRQRRAEVREKAREERRREQGESQSSGRDDADDHDDDDDRDGGWTPGG